MFVEVYQNGKWSCAKEPLDPIVKMVGEMVTKVNLIGAEQRFRISCTTTKGNITKRFDKTFKMSMQNDYLRSSTFITMKQTEIGQADKSTVDTDEK